MGEMALTRNGDEEKDGLIATALVLTRQVGIAQFNGHAVMQSNRGLRKDELAALSVEERVEVLRGFLLREVA